jgi:hypothetical protein
VGDVLTHKIIDDQSKFLVHRSVVRPFGRNRKVKCDPSLAMRNRGTAQHGGDVMPPSQVREELLSSTSDFYDNAEPSPDPHPICVTKMIRDPTPSSALDWIIRNTKTHHMHPQLPSAFKRPSHKPPKGVIGHGFKDDEGFNQDGTSPIVPLLSPDSYDGESLLRFGNDVIPENPDIQAPKQTKMTPTGMFPTTLSLSQQPQMARKPNWNQQHHHHFLQPTKKILA